MVAELERRALAPPPERVKIVESMGGDPRKLWLPEHPRAEACRDWMAHLASIAGLLDAGCTMRMDDLTPAEWRGVAMWRRALERCREMLTACPKCGKPMRRAWSSHDCGWKKEG